MRLPAPTKRRTSPLRWTIEIVVIIIVAMLLVLVVQRFVVKPFTILSGSMEPTLVQGDRVLVDRMVYHFRDPRPGEVIMFRSPLEPESDPFIKRVVAVAGDTVSVHDGALYINGGARDEPFLKEHPILDAYDQITVPPGTVFAMGDNRNHSGDSRIFGPVDVDAILGRALAVYWPVHRWNRL